MQIISQKRFMSDPRAFDRWLSDLQLEFVKKMSYILNDKDIVDTFTYEKKNCLLISV